MSAGDTKGRKGRTGAITNSTLARHTELARGAGLKKSAAFGTRSTLAPVNAERAAKRQQRRRRLAAAFRKSPVCALVRDRSQGQCEYVDAARGVWPKPTRFSLTRALWATHGRCDGFASDVHHLSYCGYGGDEDPDRLLAVCARCHALIESTFYAARQRGRT